MVLSPAEAREVGIERPRVARREREAAMTAAMWGAVAVGLLMPVAMIACYPVFRHHARRGPNRWSGYRTERALSSVRSWQVAQAMCARHWVVVGAVFSVLTLAGYALLYAAGVRDGETWWWWALLFTFLPLIGILWSAALIERRLARLDGVRGASSARS